MMPHGRYSAVVVVILLYLVSCVSAATPREPTAEPHFQALALAGLGAGFLVTLILVIAGCASKPAPAPRPDSARIEAARQRMSELETSSGSSSGRGAGTRVHRQGGGTRAVGKATRPGNARRQKEYSSDSISMSDTSDSTGSYEHPRGKASAGGQTSLSDNNEFGIPFGDLKFVKKLGEGGFGKVYEGRWKGTPVAIKKFHTHMRVSKQDYNEFRQEVEMLRSLRHPNIVLFLGVCLNESRRHRDWLIITELLQGSLYDDIHTNKKKYTEPEIHQMARDIAHGLVHLHSLKPAVIHRDLKSANILMDNGKVKLGDLGLASHAKHYSGHKSHVLKSQVGTPRWMAPEVLRGELYGCSADVYGFSLILYEMWACKLPYHDLQGDLIRDVGQKGRRPQLNESIPQHWRDLMKLCWQQTASKRPEMEQVAQLLDGMKSTHGHHHHHHHGTHQHQHKPRAGAAAAPDRARA